MSNLQTAIGEILTNEDARAEVKANPANYAIEAGKRHNLTIPEYQNLLEACSKLSEGVALDVDISPNGLW